MRFVDRLIRWGGLRVGIAVNMVCWVAILFQWMGYPILCKGVIWAVVAFLLYLIFQVFWVSR